MPQQRTLRIVGIEKLQRELQRIIKETPDKAAAALFQEGEDIMADSKENYVPVAPDGGTLKGSGFVNLPEIRGDEATVTLGFGGSAAAYATAIHEHPSDASPRSWQGKTLKFHLGGDRRKYLEKPLLKAAPTLVANVGKRLKLGR